MSTMQSAARTFYITLSALKIDMTVKEHYDNHLAEFYSWMAVDFEIAKNSFKEFCIVNEIKPLKNKIAIDLGAGNGIQSVALGELGFNVKAVDFNETLLAELKQKINELPIEPIKDDIKNIRSISKEHVDLIVCCGDTISHLETFNQLEKLINDCYNSLTTDGSLILTFRDYTTALTDIDRFIPVKSDENRILTCIIDYSEDKIKVTDLLYEKINGSWTQKISSYDKLRIRTDYVINKAQKAGFTVIRNEIKNRMIHLILKK